MRGVTGGTGATGPVITDTQAQPPCDGPTGETDDTRID